MSKQENKINYILEKKLQEHNNRLAKEFYHDLLDDILDPILEVENTFLNPQLYPSYQQEDFQGMLRELITDLKKVKFTKYKPMTMEEYLEHLERVI